jgi:predicted permease
MIAQDIRYALRQVRRAPSFTLMAVLTLALGIGASSAIFCLMDGLWLRPVHVPHPGRLVRVFAKTPQDQVGRFTFLEYQAMAQRATAFQGRSAGLIAMGGRGSLMPNGDGTTTLLLNYVVSDNFFSVLGVKPMLGRVFTPADAETLRTHPGVVLGYRCWKRNFGGDEGIVGRQIPLRRGESRIEHVDVWGVLPPDFRDVYTNSDRDLWMATETWAAIANGGKDLTSREFRWFQVLGRLAPGATAAEADRQVATIAGALAAEDPANNKGRSARAISDFRFRMDEAGTSGLVLMAIVGGVVLLCTVNVAQLLLARALSRAPLSALRLSLGATRWAVIRQVLIENLLLCALSLMAGLAVAAGIAALLPRLLVNEPAMLVSFGSTARFQLDWRVFSLAGLVALVTMLLLALVPIRQVSRTDILPVLQAAAIRSAVRVPMARRAAIWVQIAVAFALMVSTGVLVRSFLNTRTRSIGITRNEVLVAFAQDPDVPIRNELLEKLRAMPGVKRVAYGIRSPLMPSEGGIAAKVMLPDHPDMRDQVSIKYNAVSPEFLDVTGTRVIRGRGFTAEDDANGPPVVVISEAMARKYWPGGDPMGRVVRLPAFRGGKDLEARVIGVAEDAPISQIGEIAEPYMYLPFHWQDMGEMTAVMETSQNAMSMAQSARQVFIHQDPRLDPMFITSLPELIRWSAGEYQMMAELVTALGFIGLALTIVGLYGFLAFRVTQRRREIGIRMALGASREATSRLVFRDTAMMGLIGLGLGMVLAVGASRLESSLVFGVNTLDAVSMAGALGVLALAIAAASWLPARRAASIDPMQALRNE